MFTQKEYKEWILQIPTEESLTIKETEEGNISVDSEYAHGEAAFHDQSLVELSVMNKVTDEPAFYLHFQLNTKEHAEELFNEMLECVRSIKEKKIHKILLSCSSGLTTGFFADKLNEAIELLSLNYHVEAVAYSDLFKVGDDYELICIAPQISYNLSKIQEKLPHANIIKIPSQIFAAYDTGEMIKLIQQYVNDNVTLSIAKPQSYRDLKPHEKAILCLNIIRNSRRTHIIYAVYDANNFLLMNDEVIKPKIYLNDIYDAIDIALCKYPTIECIGMSLPGIINSKQFISANYVNGLNNHNLDDLFTKRYHKKFVFTNDANAAAVGYYSTQHQYENLSFIYQPLYYRAGIGNIVNGKLLVGAHRLSGEVKLVPLDLSKSFYELIKEPGGAIEILAKQIVVLVTTLDPEAIVVCSQLVPDIEVLKAKVLELLKNEEYIPELISVPHFHIFLFLGQLILCIESLQNQ